MFQTKNVCFSILYKKGLYTFFVKIEIKKVMVDFKKIDCNLIIFLTLCGHNFFNFDFYKKVVKNFFVEN